MDNFCHYKFIDRCITRPIGHLLSDDECDKGETCCLLRYSRYIHRGFNCHDFSLSGMGIILNTFPAVYEGIKIVGACYLIFLGFMALKRVDNNTETSKKRKVGVRDFC